MNQEPKRVFLFAQEKIMRPSNIFRVLGKMLAAAIGITLGVVFAYTISAIIGLIAG